MKLSFRKNFIVNGIFLVAGLTFFAFNFCSKPADETPPLISIIKEGIDALHYSPQKIDDNFSKKLFALYLKRMDPQKKFLTASDVAQLKKFETKLDDEITAGTYEFFDLSFEIVKADMARTKRFYPVILEKPFDFTKNETLETDDDKIVFCKDTIAQKDQWRLYLKYETMLRVSDKMDEQQKALDNKDTSYHEMSTEKIEEYARTKVKKSNDDFYSRMDDFDKDDWRAIYLNCITNLEDPHTEYFPPADEANFNIAMSGQLQGIGAQLQQVDDYTKVSSIVTGSPSWKDGRLKAGDIILKVAQGKEDAVDIVGMKLDKAVQLIRGKKGTEVKLTVKKPDGSIVVIDLIRDIVVLEDTYAKSLIVGKDNSRFGYIRLPEFYADFNGNGGRSSAADVKKELEKLNEEKVSGVIIDLRENGGGSLDDAVKMGGLFVAKGPMCQVKTKTGNANILMDYDATITYNGPVVVLVNENSASASEILAAALQDYHRAVIVGSPTTFGKGTVQRMYDLDQLLKLKTEDPSKALGSLKITQQKFYRISGGSTQLKGVTPDIILPDVTMFLKYGEKEQDYPMPWDEIAPATYTTYQNEWSLGSWITSSKQRTTTSDYFNTISAIAAELKSESENTTVSLNIEKYRADQAQKKLESKKIEELNKNKNGLNIENLLVDSDAIKADSTKVARNNEFIKAIGKDFYVGEAVNILGDMKN